MKNRLLAAILSISIIISGIPGMPATAAERTSRFSEDSTTFGEAAFLDGNDKGNQEIINPDTPSSGEETTIPDTASSDGEIKESTTPDTASSDAEAGELATPDTASSDEKNEESTTPDTPSSNEKNEEIITPDTPSSDGKDEELTTPDTPESDEETEEPTPALSDDDATSDDTPSAADPVSPEISLDIESPAPLEAAAANITPLTYGETNHVTLVKMLNTYEGKWFSFTAPEAGYYNFHPAKANESEARCNLQLYNEADLLSASPVRDLYVNNLHTNYMEKDSTVFIRLSSSSTYDMDMEVDISIQKFSPDTPDKLEDGSSLFSYNDYNLAISQKIGAFKALLPVEMMAKDGGTLEDSYVLVIHLVNKETGKSDKSDYAYINHKDYKQQLYVEPYADTEYEFHILIEDRNYNVLSLCTFDMDGVISETDEIIKIHDITRTENSIMLEIEPRYGCNCYYAPADGSEEEKNWYIPSWDKYEFKDLKASTAYVFDFTDENRKTLFKQTIETIAPQTDISYSAKISDDGQSLELQADVSGYKGNDERATFNYEYVNALGETASYAAALDLTNIEVQEGIGKNFSLKTSLLLTKGLFEADKQYNIKMWLELDGCAVIKKEQAVTTPKAAFNAEDLLFTIITGESADPRQARLNIKINNLNTEVSGYVYSKRVGSEETYYNETYDGPIILSPDVTTEKFHSVFGSSGVEKEYVLIIGGVKKTLTETILPSGVRLTKAADDEINPFDFVRTYQLESAVDGQKLSGSYYLKLLYTRYPGSQSYDLFIDNAAEFNEENKYKAQVRTADGISDESTNSPIQLEPDTDYHLQWSLRDSENEEILSFCETIHTGKPDITLEQVESNFQLQKYLVTLNGNDVKNFAGAYKVDLYAYLKKEGNVAFRDYNIKPVTLNNDNEYSGYLTISELETKTSYDLSLNNDKSYLIDKIVRYEYAAASFTTPEDTRNIKITSAIPDFHSITLKCKLTGFTPSQTDWLLCFIRKPGAQEYKRVAYDSYRFEDGEIPECTLKITAYNGVKLEDNTKYEYIIGVGPYYDTAYNKLGAAITGDFSTKEDKRALSGAGVRAAYTIADISAVFNGNEQSAKTYFHLFYRKAALSSDGLGGDVSASQTADAKWTKAKTQNTSEAMYNYQARLTGLEPDTAYEYVLVFADSINCSSPDEITKEKMKAAGEFSTKKCGYTFNFTINEGKTTTNTAVIDVSAQGGTDERIDVAFTLNNGQEQNVALRQTKDYKGEIVFTNLTHGTQYAITGAAISVTENNAPVTIAELPLNYEFETKHAKIPESITFSKEKTSLNAMYADGVYEGYNSETLKPVILPEDSDKELVYSSSNEAAAVVTDEGVVIAKGSGTALITAVSAYDADIKAVCEVTVKKYAAVYKYADGKTKIFGSYSDVYSISKGNSTGNITLYDCDDVENLTTVSDFTVTSAKTDIAEWKDSKLYANAVGLTSLTFEKDGVKANLMVNVTAKNVSFDITGFTTSNGYPAIKEENGSYTLAYDSKHSLSYTAVIAISPNKDYNPQDFSFTISTPDTAVEAASQAGGNGQDTAAQTDSNGQDRAAQADNNGEYAAAAQANGSAQATDIAQVNNNGVITIKKPGSVKLTVKPSQSQSDNPDSAPYINGEASVILNIKALPAQDEESIYALANTCAKIGDVQFPDTWGEGWSWKFPDTPLVTNGVYKDNSYPFEAVYSGTENYPCDRTLKVYIGKITGINIYEPETAGIALHNQVLEAGEGDFLTLKAEPLTQGKDVPDTLYNIEIPDVKGLTITKTDASTFTIKAQKKGNYKLKPEIKASALGKAAPDNSASGKAASTKAAAKKAAADKPLAAANYKITAVDKKQTALVTLTSDTEGVEITDNAIIFNKTSDTKEFTLKAEVKDRSGADISTALVWKSTNKKAAVIAPASKKDTHVAKVTIKSSGHTVISVTSKDTRKLSASLNLEIQDLSPRVSTNKAAVNLAYDYDNASEGTGRIYAAQDGGTVDIIPVYGESIKTVELRDESGSASAGNLTIKPYKEAECKYLVYPAADNIEPGTYNCTIYVKTKEAKTDKENDYSYPLKVSVIDKAPSVSAKMADVPNLFFKDTYGHISVKVSGKGAVGDGGVIWEDSSNGINNGFSIYSLNDYNAKKKTSRLWISQQSGLKLENGQLTEPDVAKGTLTIKLTGYKKPYTFENFTIKYNYKKPVLTTISSGSLIPDIGKNSSSFEIYDKTNKNNLYLGKEISNTINTFYEEITCDSSDVKITPKEGYAQTAYSYNGTEKNKKINLTLEAPLWREPLTVAHTLKTIKPSVYLSNNTLTYNTNFKSTAYSYIRLKNAQDIAYTDIVITPVNAKAKKLIDDDSFIITASGNEIKVEQNTGALAGTTVAAGTYSYKVTPYCTKPGTDEKIALKAMNLKIKVINKPFTVKVSPKGTIDLTYGAYSQPLDKKNAAALVDPKFSNLGSEYEVKSARLIGEYSGYFTNPEKGSILYGKKRQEHYYIGVKNDDSIRKLKAGQPYRLAIEYTMTNNNGGEFKITSNTFTIKPRQSKAKVTVENNNQALYAGAADTLSRTYSLSVPAYYGIQSVSGGIDCNKDGRNDIEVSGTSKKGSRYLDVTVRISDKDAVGTAANGKSYSIPVTVELVGRDGIAKDVKVRIKVRVYD